jgi:alkylation response protein AidB-like acyl-CoA dehydrogenase
MLARKLFTAEHEQFRQSVRRFAQKEVVPYYDQWEKDGCVSRELWRKAGALGLLGINLPEAYGGGEANDFRYSTIVIEELMLANAPSVGFSLHADVAAPYMVAYTTEEQKERWLPGIAAGDLILAIAMTEPSTGSDLAAVRTTAMRDGDAYILNGQKTFITNGLLSDLVIVVAKTEPSAGRKGISLLVVERGMEGFRRGRKLEKIGLHAQDTAELFFDNVRVPAANLLGEEGKGFAYLMSNLPQERLTIAIKAVAACEFGLEVTAQYCHERSAFGQPIGTFQSSRFALAEMQTETQVARVFVDRCVEELNAGTLSNEAAAMAKWWTTELEGRVLDRCLQLHGGYGYMLEYPIARAYLDARVQRIYGGTNEIMKEIIGRSMGF